MSLSIMPVSFIQLYFIFFFQEAAVKYDNLKAIEDRHFHVPSTLNKKL